MSERSSWTRAASYLGGNVAALSAGGGGGEYGKTPLAAPRTTLYDTVGDEQWGCVEWRGLISCVLWIPACMKKGGGRVCTGGGHTWMRLMRV